MSAVKDYCYITQRENGVYVEGSFNQEFIAALKENVPADHRVWDGYNKRWWVSNQYADRVRRYALNSYAEVFEV